jgi:hypothetical protein
MKAFPFALILLVNLLTVCLLSCDDDDQKQEKLIPVELVPTSLELEWQKLETSISADDKFFILTVSHFGIPWGSTEPSSPPDYCTGNCNRDRLYFYIEKSKLQPNSTIELSNGTPQTNHNGPPAEGSYLVYDFFIDDPPKGVYYYTAGTITITDIIERKIYGTFSISDPFATYTDETITGEFNGVPLDPVVITLD